MPKVSKVGKFRQTAAAAVAPAVTPAKTVTVTARPVAEPNVDNVDDREHENALSRGQRKRQAKKDQYLKRQKLVLSTLLLQKQEDQKKRIDGLDALKEALQATMAEVHVTSTNSEGAALPSQHKITNKSKKELAAREVSHLALVLEHPAFQSNPFATIQEHLKNTLAGQAKELESEGKTKALEKTKLADKRKRVKKARQREDGGKHRKKFRATRTRSSSRK